MQPSFKPPKDEEELRKRADEMSVPAVHALRASIVERRKKAIAPFDAEIAFYDAVLELKGESNNGPDNS